MGAHRLYLLPALRWRRIDLVDKQPTVTLVADEAILLALRLTYRVTLGNHRYAQKVAVLRVFQHPSNQMQLGSVGDEARNSPTTLSAEHNYLVDSVEMLEAAGPSTRCAAERGRAGHDRALVKVRKEWRERDH